MEDNGFGFRFYNAGKRVSQMLRFTISEGAQGKGGYSANDMQGTGSWPLEIPEKGWVFVPTEVPSGNETVRVNFKRDIQVKLGAQGVVMLLPTHNPANEDPEKELSAYPFAPTEELVIARAEQLWNLYTLSVISQHLQDSDQALAAGGRPRKATGFTKFCFGLHNKIDPGDTYAHAENVQKPGAVSGDVAAVLSAMQTQQSATNAILIALASGEKLTPEMLKALTVPAAGLPASVGTGVPITSGIATGKIAKPIEGSDGWVKGSGNLDKGTLQVKDAPKQKNDRARDAVGAL